MTLKDQLRPGTRVLVYKAGGEAMYAATVVRVNKRSITIEAAGEKKRVLLDAIADLAPGERDRQAMKK
jgi:hypothetical protein